MKKDDQTKTGKDGDETKAESQTDASSGGEQIDLRRRALIHAGWSVPVVTAVHALPLNPAFAQSPHGDGHDDTAHTDVHDDHADTSHSDTHNDSHGDGPVHGDNHTDNIILSFHSDSPNAGHLDGHGDSHTDSP